MINKDTYKRITARLANGKAVVDFIASGAGRIKTVDRLAELEDKIENGTLVELPRIIHPNAREWFVQFQYETGVFDYYIYYTKAEAEAKLKELQEGKKRVNL